MIGFLLASGGIEIISASIFGGAAVFYGLRGTDTDAAHAVRAVTVPLGSVVFDSYVNHRTDRRALSAADAVLGDAELFVADAVFIKGSVQK